MPIKENFTFEGDDYRAEVKRYSMATLRQQETAMARKYLTSSFSTGAGVGAAPFTGGLTLVIAYYKGRSTYVASKKHDILQDEIRRRGATPRDVDFEDAAAAIGVGAAGLVVGAEVGNFAEGVTGTDNMGSHLPDGANKSTGLTTDFKTAIDGAGGQVELLAAYLSSGDPKEVAETVTAGDKTAYHAGMVQAQIIEEQIGSEGIEALLVALTSPPVEPARGCERADMKGHTLNCTLCKKSIEKNSIYWHCCRCKQDDYDICLDCRKKSKICRNKNHELTKLVLRN